MSYHTDLLAFLVERPELLATLLTATASLAGSLVHYRLTGRLPIGRLPYRALQDVWGELADQYFGTTRPKGVPGVIVDADVPELEADLRAACFESADDYAYEYEAERLNMRRPNGTRRHPETGEPVPMELHPRVFETDGGGLLVIAHDEASRAEAWGAHLKEMLLSWERGRDQFQTVLDERGLDYETIESERAANVEVVA